MNFKFFSFILIAALAFSSCEKEEMMSDDELISAIQNASKQVVDAADLPFTAAAFLSSEFSDRYNERTLLANGLGYEVRMADGDRPDDGSDDGGDGDDRPDDGSDDDGDGDRIRSYVYFDLDGRQLGDRPDDGSGGGDDRDDRPDDGSNYDCPDLEANIGEECRDSNGNIGVVNSDCECN